MIEVPGEVVSVDGDRVLVRATPRASGCGRCNEPGGCGSAKVGSMFQQEAAHFWLANRIGAREGEQVRICLAEEVSLHAALRGYLIPVVGIVLGAAAGVFFGGDSASDAHALGGAVLGLGLGILVSRGLARPGGGASEPELKRVAGDEC